MLQSMGRLCKLYSIYYSYCTLVKKGILASAIAKYLLSIDMHVFDVGTLTKCGDMYDLMSTKNRETKVLSLFFCAGLISLCEHNFLHIVSR